MMSDKLRAAALAAYKAMIAAEIRKEESVLKI